MIVVWKGSGPVVLFVLGACLGVTVLGWAYLQTGGRPEGYYTTHDWRALTSAGFFLAAGVCYALGLRLNRPTGKLVIDAVTGREMIYRVNHHFFFINIESWAVVYVVLGLAFWLP